MAPASCSHAGSDLPDFACLEKVAGTCHADQTSSVTGEQRVQHLRRASRTEQGGAFVVEREDIRCAEMTYTRRSVWAPRLPSEKEVPLPEMFIRNSDISLTAGRRRRPVALNLRWMGRLATRALTHLPPIRGPTCSASLLEMIPASGNRHDELGLCVRQLDNRLRDLSLFCNLSFDVERELVHCEHLVVRARRAGGSLGLPHGSRT